MCGFYRQKLVEHVVATLIKPRSASQAATKWATTVEPVALMPMNCLTPIYLTFSACDLGTARRTHRPGDRSAASELKSPAPVYENSSTPCTSRSETRRG